MPTNIAQGSRAASWRAAGRDFYHNQSMINRVFCVLHIIHTSQVPIRGCYYCCCYRRQTIGGLAPTETATRRRVDLRVRQVRRASLVVSEMNKGECYHNGCSKKSIYGEEPNTRYIFSLLSILQYIYIYKLCSGHPWDKHYSMRVPL